MKNIVIINIIILIFSSNAKSQDLDLTHIADCKLLHEKGLLKEARNCYLKHDNNVYAIYGAAMVSKQLSDLKSFNKLSQKLISKKYRSPISFKLCANLYTNNPIKFIEIIKNGLKNFANDTGLLALQINFYISQKNYIEIINLADTLIKYKHDQKRLFFAKGYAYENIKDNKNALINYEKAIEIDSTYFDAYFNIGTFYYNQGVSLYKQANNQVGYDEHLQLTAKSEEEFKKAIPYFKKADEIKPDELRVLNILKTIYNTLKENDNLMQVERRIDKIKKK